jgi:hypothetical protein
MRGNNLIQSLDYSHNFKFIDLLLLLIPNVLYIGLLVNQYIKQVTMNMKNELPINNK